MNLIPFIKSLRAALIEEKEHGTHDFPTGLFETKEIAVAIAQWYTPAEVSEVSLSSSKLRLYDSAVCMECGHTLFTKGLVFCSADCLKHHTAEVCRKADLASLEQEVREADAAAQVAVERVTALRHRLREARGY